MLKELDGFFPAERALVIKWMMIYRVIRTVERIKSRIVVVMMMITTIHCRSGPNANSGGRCRQVE